MTLSQNRILWSDDRFGLLHRLHNIIHIGDGTNRQPVLDSIDMTIRFKILRQLYPPPIPLPAIC